MRYLCIFILLILTQGIYSQDYYIHIKLPQTIERGFKFVTNDYKTVFLISDKEIYSTKNYGDTFELVNIPFLTSDEYIKDLVFNKFGRGYLATNNCIYETDQECSNFTNIGFPHFKDIDISNDDIYSENWCDSKPDNIKLYLSGNDLFLYSSILHCNDRIHYYDKKINNWIKLFLNYYPNIPEHYQESLVSSGYKNIFTFVNKNTGFGIIRSYNLIKPVDSLFITDDLGNEWEFINYFCLDNSPSKSRIIFFNEKSGLYYNINNQYFDVGTEAFMNSTPKSKIKLFITKDGGENWRESVLPYNDIDLIKFINEKTGFIICHNIKTDGIYELDEKGFKYNVSGNEPIDFSYYILKTYDGGETWQDKQFISRTVESFGAYDFRLEFLNDSVGWLYAGDYSYSTKDCGRSWNYVHLKLNFFPLNENLIFAYKYDSLWRVNIENSFISNEIAGEIIEKKFNENLYEYKNEIEEWKKNILLNEKRNKAYDYYKEKKYSEAITLLLELISEKDYYEYDNLFKLAYSFSEIGENDRALYYYEECLKLDSGSSSVYNNIGVIYEKKELFDESLKHFQKAYEIDPEEKLYENNKKRLESLTYKLTDNDYKFLERYFPMHKSGSKFVYWQDNNTASCCEKVFREKGINSLGSVETNCYPNYECYKSNLFAITIFGEYILEDNELNYLGINNQEYYTVAKFPFDYNRVWNVNGFETRYLGFADGVSTFAGVFNNCLVIGNDYVREYYAPHIGLIMVESALNQPYFITEKELIEFDIIP